MINKTIVHERRSKIEDRRVVPPRDDKCRMARGGSEVRQHKTGCHCEESAVVGRPWQSSDYKKDVSNVFELRL